MNKEGKLDSYTAETTVETTAVTTQADTRSNNGAGGGMIEGFMTILSFRNEAFGDQIKFFLVMLLAFYLVFNYMRWQMIIGKIGVLENQLLNLENLAKELIQKSTSTCSNSSSN